MLAPRHPQQDERLQALRDYAILDTPTERDFDDIVALVAEICDAPVSVINFIDADRQWFKAEVGLNVRSTPLETSLCSHVILENEFVEIPDTLADPRMCDNPLCVADGGFRFYAGALLETEDGLPLGTLCVLDTRPRVLTELQRRAIRTLARRVMRELELRRALGVQDVLRREVDHRVKNSLASLGAVIQLQINRTPGAEAREALEAVLGRLHALGALHEEVYSGEAGMVDVARLIERVVGKLKMLIGERIRFALDLAPLSLAAEHASPLMLIVNEFVTNSDKHGFGEQGGTITVQVEQDGDGYRMRCRDDGSGDAATVARIGSSRGLGMRVIDALAGSIGADVRWGEAKPGVELTIRVRKAAAV